MGSGRASDYHAGNHAGFGGRNRLNSQSSGFGGFDQLSSTGGAQGPLHLHLTLMPRACCHGRVPGNEALKPLQILLSILNELAWRQTTLTTWPHGSEQLNSLSESFPQAPNDNGGGGGGFPTLVGVTTKAVQVSSGPSWLISSLPSFQVLGHD